MPHFAVIDQARSMARRVVVLVLNAADALRSQRGRTITHADRCVLDALPAPLLAIGADDAGAAAWVPNIELRPPCWCGDHCFTVQTIRALD